MTGTRMTGTGRRRLHPASIGLRAGLIFAPLAGAIVLMGTLDAASAAIAAVVGGLVTGVFFGAAAALGGRRPG